MTFKDGNPGVAPGGMAVWHDVKDSGHDYLGWWYLDGTRVTAGVEVRPLVMLDPQDETALEHLVEAITDAMHEDGYGGEGWSGLTLSYRRDMLRDVLTEYVTPKPPKPAEPTGRLAVVVDDNGVEWTRLGFQYADGQWFSERGGAGGDYVEWSDIPVTSPDQIKFAGL